LYKKDRPNYTYAKCDGKLEIKRKPEEIVLIHAKYSGASLYNKKPQELDFFGHQSCKNNKCTLDGV